MDQGIEEVRQRTDLIIVHCAATKPSLDIGVKDIDRWHRQRGWLKVGYHFVIRRDGTREKGRDLMEPGAHAAGYNHRSVGVCLVGGLAEDGVTPENNFTDAQWATLRLTLKELRADFPEARIIGHREVEPSKACPSFDVQEYLKDKPDLQPPN